MGACGFNITVYDFLGRGGFLNFHSRAVTCSGQNSFSRTFLSSCSATVRCAYNVPYTVLEGISLQPIGTFRICYETNAKRKFDSARNRFVENRFQVSRVVMQII